LSTLIYSLNSVEWSFGCSGDEMSLVRSSMTPYCENALRFRSFLPGRGYSPPNWNWSITLCMYPRTYMRCHVSSFFLGSLSDRSPWLQTLPRPTTIRLVYVTYTLMNIFLFPSIPVPPGKRTLACIALVRSYWPFCRPSPSLLNTQWNSNCCRCTSSSPTLLFAAPKWDSLLSAFPATMVFHPSVPSSLHRYRVFPSFSRNIYDRYQGMHLSVVPAIPIRSPPFLWFISFRLLANFIVHYGRRSQYYSH